MSQSEKAALYRELKEAGVTFDRHYREYSTDELSAAVAELRNRLAADGPVAEAYEPPAEDASAAEAFARMTGTAPEPEPQPTPPPPAPQPAVPVARRNENELPGQRLNESVELQPIRTDEQGRVWYQEEVLKPAYPKPRGRRVLKYMDTGTKIETVKNGEYVETFEVAGDMPSRPAEVKITLPSYQVGIFKDRRFPFKVHTYNGNQGFDLTEVQDYYGGAELVPAEIKRIYVENVLCYDIRTTVRAIQTEYRQLQLTGKVK